MYWLVLKGLARNQTYIFLEQNSCSLRDIYASQLYSRELISYRLKIFRLNSLLLKGCSFSIDYPRFLGYLLLVH